MARYISIWKEKSVVVSLAYNNDYSHWISEHEYMAAIEDDDGRLVTVPMMTSEFCVMATAEECLESAKSEKVDVLMPCDCYARDAIIKDNITEWICNDGAVFNASIVEAVCHVVSMLTRNGMWKDEYAKSIDVNYHAAKDCVASGPD